MSIWPSAKWIDRVCNPGAMPSLFYTSLISTGLVPVGSQLVGYLSPSQFLCSPPGLSRRKRRLSRDSTGDSRYFPRDKPGGEQK